MPPLVTRTVLSYVVNCYCVLVLVFLVFIIFYCFDLTVFRVSFWRFTLLFLILHFILFLPPSLGFYLHFRFFGAILWVFKILSLHNMSWFYLLRIETILLSIVFLTFLQLSSPPRPVPIMNSQHTIHTFMRVHLKEKWKYCIYDSVSWIFYTSL